MKKKNLKNLKLNKQSISSFHSTSLNGGVYTKATICETCDCTFNNCGGGTNNCGTNNCGTNNCESDNCYTNAHPASDPIHCRGCVDDWF